MDISSILSETNNSSDISAAQQILSTTIIQSRIENSVAACEQ